MNLKQIMQLFLIVLVILVGGGCDQNPLKKTEQKTPSTSTSKEIQPHEYFGISAQDFIQRLEQTGIKQNEFTHEEEYKDVLNSSRKDKVYLIRIKKMKEIQLDSHVSISLVGNQNSTNNLTEVSLNFRIVDVESPIVRTILKTTFDIATQNEEESNEIIDEFIEQYRPYIKNGFTSKKIEKRIRINGYSIFYTTFKSVIGFSITKES